ncbi:MAG: MMPL family transporter [Candidatus Omnitrophica bacterium]|nr:MMPL family transporter [Candidatus Omnitrophota bacterium]
MRYDFAARRAPLVLVVLGVFSAVLVYFLTGIRMDNSIDVFFVQNDPNLQFYNEYRERFGTEEFFLICLAKDDAFSQETMDLVRDLSGKLEGFEELDQVESLAKVYDIWKKAREEGGIAHDLETFREDTLNSPFYVGLLVSETGRDSAIMAQLSPKGMADRPALVEKIKSLVAETIPKERTVYLAGPATFNYELNRLSRQSARTFYPLIVVAGAILLWAILRSLSMMLAVWVAVIASVVWGLGAMVAAGKSLNVVTSALPPILLVSTISYSLHLLLEYRRQLSMHTDKRHAIACALDMVSIPCLLSAVTTSIGFGSLVVSHVGPVIDLGLFAALAVLGGYVAVVFGLAALIALIPAPKNWRLKEHEESGAAEKSGGWYFGFKENWRGARWPIILAGLLYTAISGWYASKVFFEANPFEFFPPESEFSERLHYLQDHLTGLSRMEVQVKRKDGAELLNLKDLKQVNEAAEKLREIKSITKVITAADFVMEGRRSRSLGDESAYQLPRREIQLRQTVEGILNDIQKKRMETYFAEDHTYTKITLNSLSMGSRGYGRLLGEIDEALKETLGEEFEYRVTGLVPLVDSSQAYMVQSQIQSIVLAIAAIALTFVILLKSLRLTILGLLPNLIPILGTFGFMGFIEMPLDVATIMVASVSLGIVVDNTIHFLFRYKRYLRKEGRMKAAIDTLRTSGQAIAIAGFINCLGFGVLIFSGFRPMRNFGTLVSLTMLGALIGATVLLPALLIALGPASKKEKETVAPTK